MSKCNLHKNSQEEPKYLLIHDKEWSQVDDHTSPDTLRHVICRQKIYQFAQRSTRSYIKIYDTKDFEVQECIPVGCVPAAH